MTLHVFDTDILTLYQDGNAAVHLHVRGHAAAELAVSVISVEERS